MAVVRVDVFSDVICPWCLVGRHRFARAVEMLAGLHDVEITWKPFQLNPWMPAEGMERSAYRAAKFGSAERSSSMDGRLTAMARDEGIELAFDRIVRTPNTFDAHRLIWLANQRGCQIEVVDALFRAYFQEGRDVGDRSVLAALAAEAGLDADEVRAFLASDAGVAEVEEEESVGRSLGIDGVPFFLFEGKYGVSGAQPAEVMVDVIRQVVELEGKNQTKEEAREEAALAAVASGAACAVDAPENC